MIVYIRTRRIHASENIIKNFDGWSNNIDSFSSIIIGVFKKKKVYVKCLRIWQIVALCNSIYVTRKR